LNTKQPSNSFKSLVGFVASLQAYHANPTRQAYKIMQPCPTNAVYYIRTGSRSTARFDGLQFDRDL